MLIEIHDYAQDLVLSENPDEQWYVPYAELAIDKGFVNLTEAPYDPLRFMNRADIAEMTYRSMIYKEPLVEEVIEQPVISMGEQDAPVTIVEYSDYQCPFCAKLYEETFEQIKADYIDKGDVHYIVKDFPLSFHAQAAKASHAARCANDQDKFWEMRDLIYTNQSTWSKADDSSTNFSDYAESLELDMPLFDSCMEGEIHMSEINVDLIEGQLAGVMGTPTLIVNGEFFVGSQPYEELIDLIDRLLYANF
jgi:protein-disulfide isomerase